MSNLHRRPNEPRRHPRLRLLGRFEVVQDGRTLDPATWRLRKAAALVKLLALEPQRALHQEQALDTLWPDLEPDAAAAALRRTLHVPRRILAVEAPSSWLQRRGQMLVLGPPELTPTDVEAFEFFTQEVQPLVG